VVDLKNITYISSAGFRAVLIANRAAAGQQGKLALCGVIGEVKRAISEKLSILTEASVGSSANWITSAGKMS
jgi:anti-anti-sigma regulatory factor